MTEPGHPDTAASTIVAYCTNPWLQMFIVPAEARRDWMEATDRHFANRCLPLLMANQHGWFILNTWEFSVTWNGGNKKEDLVVTYPPEAHGEPLPAVSHFGHGILTFLIPYVFRTPRGYNLLARGPANLPKDGISPLEGLIETDWTTSSFTMNWKVTRPGLSIVFGDSEPVCMIVPVRRGEIESFSARQVDIDDDPDFYERFERWQQGRSNFLEELQQPGSAAQVRGWQKDYFQGLTPEGSPHPEHQTRLKLSPFEVAKETI